MTGEEDAFKIEVNVVKSYQQLLFDLFSEDFIADYTSIYFNYQNFLIMNQLQLSYFESLNIFNFKFIIMLLMCF